MSLLILVDFMLRQGETDPKDPVVLRFNDVPRVGEYVEIDDENYRVEQIFHSPIVNLPLTIYGVVDVTVRVK